MKFIERVKGPTPLKWKKVMLYVQGATAALGTVVLAVPSSWVDPELKNFIFAVLGFIASAVTGFAQTRVQKKNEVI